MTDLDNSVLADATVSIGTGFVSGEDNLLFANNASTMGNIAGSYNASASVLTLSSSGNTATLAQWQAALRSVQYSNSSDDPSTSARTINFAVNDGALGSNVIASTVNVTAVNDAPELSGVSTISYIENATAAVINSAITVSDLDNSSLANAIVSIGTGFNSVEDVLSFANNPSTMGNIAGSYNSSTGVLTLTSSGNTATLAQWQAALRSVQYNNSSDNPSSATRTINYAVNDGELNSNIVASAIHIATINDAPVLNGVSNISYTENADAKVINNAITVTDLDNSTLANATISIGTGFNSSQDILSFTPNASSMGNIIGSYNATTGVLTLSSNGNTATLAQWQAALRSIQYSNNSDAPSTNARTINFAVNDGSLSSNIVSSTVNVIALNDAPSLTTVPVGGNISQSAIGTGIFTSLFTNTDISTGEANQYVQSIKIMVSNVLDGANEQLYIDGSIISLARNISGITADHGILYQITIANNIAEIQLINNSTNDVATINNVINNLTYRNASQNPTGGVRSVTLQEISDSGDGRNYEELSYTSKVIVNAKIIAPLKSTAQVTIVPQITTPTTQVFYESRLADNGKLTSANGENAFADSSYSNSSSNVVSGVTLNSTTLTTMNNAAAKFSNAPSWGWQNIPAFINLNPIVQGLTFTLNQLNARESAAQANSETKGFAPSITTPSELGTSSDADLLKTSSDERKSTTSEVQKQSEQKVAMSKITQFQQKVKNLLKDFGLSSGDDSNKQG